MEFEQFVDNFKERANKADKTLTEAFLCKNNKCAVVEVVEAGHEMAPQKMIEDIELAFDAAYLPALSSQMEVDADYVPAIDVFHGVVLLATAFGCEVAFEANGWPRALPLLKSIQEVDYLKKPDINKSYWVQRYVDQVRWLQDKTDHRIPIKKMDLQSPFTNATFLRPYADLLLDVIDAPQQVRKLLEIITEVSMEFLELQDKVFTCPASPGRNFPCVRNNIGICIADDAALIPLSPAMYEDFCLPTMMSIAENVEGVFLHCCGDYSHQIDNLMKIPNLRSLQMHTGPGEIDSLSTWRKIRGQVSLWSDTNEISLGDEYNGRMWDCYNEYVLPRLLEGNRGGLILLSPSAPTIGERRENVNHLRQILANSLTKEL